MNARYLIFALLLFAGLSARAELAQYKGRYKMAMEIELTADQTVPLIPLYDWKRVERDVADGTFVLWPEYRDKLAALKKPLSEAPAALLAEIMLQALMEKSNYPPLKAELVEKDGPLRDVTWTRDGTKIEFAFDGPTSDPADYLARMDKFAKATGLQEKLKRPYGKGLPEISFHVHISRNDGADLRSRVSALNKLWLLRMVDQGVAGELFDGTRTTRYYDDISKRGILRIFSPDDHFEIRRHLDDPETEMAEVLRWLDLAETKAVGEIQKATEALLTPKNIEALLNHSVTAAISVLSENKPGLSDPRLAKALSAAIANGRTVDVGDALELLQEKGVKGTPGARDLLRKISNEAQKKLAGETLAKWLVSAPPDAVVKVIKVSGDHATREPRLKTDSAALGDALEEIFTKKPNKFSAPALLRLLAPRNSAMRAVALKRVASGTLAPEELRSVIGGLGTDILRSPEGWTAVEALLKRGVRWEIAHVNDQMVRYPGFSSAQMGAVLHAEAASEPSPVRDAGSASNPIRQFLRSCRGDRK